MGSRTFVEGTRPRGGAVGLLFELQPHKAEGKSGAEDGGDFVKAILHRFQQGLQGSLVA